MSDVALPSPGSAGSESVFSEILGEVTRQAQRRLSQESPSQQPTALINEAYEHLSKDSNVELPPRSLFLRFAARAVRNMLVEYERAKSARERPSFLERVVQYYEDQHVDLLELESGIIQLYADSPDTARVLELRYFAGASFEEIGQALGLEPKVVEQKWKLARTYLHRLIPPAGDSSSG